MPTALLGSLGTPDVVLNGSTLDADVTHAVTDITTNRTITGASTLTVAVTDPERKLLRSKVFASRSRLGIDGLVFTQRQVTKSGESLSVVFEDANVSALRQVKGKRVAKAGTTTRSQFASLLVRESPGVTLHAYPNAKATHEPLARHKHENTWNCLTRLANEVNWRVFSDGTAIWFGPDDWLLSFPSLLTIKENTGGVDTIDFDFDGNKRATSITVTCNTDVWTVPPGSVVTVADMGVIDGPWLVATITRSLFSPQATVTLTGPQKALPEPKPSSSSTTGSGDVPLWDITTKAANTVAGSVVATAKSFLGVPYVWGGESPSGVDCSGLTQLSYSRAGISIPRTSQAQYAAGPKVKADDTLLPGDLVFFVGSDGTASAPGHVGIYIGNGKFIDAPHTGADVRVDDLSGFPGYVGATRPWK